MLCVVVLHTHASCGWERAGQLWAAQKPKMPLTFLVSFDPTSQKFAKETISWITGCIEAGQHTNGTPPTIADMKEMAKQIAIPDMERSIRMVLNGILNDRFDNFELFNAGIESNMYCAPFLQWLPRFGASTPPIGFFPNFALLAKALLGHFTISTSQAEIDARVATFVEICEGFGATQATKERAVALNLASLMHTTAFEGALRDYLSPTATLPAQVAVRNFLFPWSDQAWKLLSRLKLTSMQKNNLERGTVEALCTQHDVDWHVLKYRIALIDAVLTFEHDNEYDALKEWIQAEGDVEDYFFDILDTRFILKLPKLAWKDLKLVLDDTAISQVHVEVFSSGNAVLARELVSKFPIMNLDWRTAIALVPISVLDHLLLYGQSTGDTLDETVLQSREVPLVGTLANRVQEEWPDKVDRLANLLLRKRKRHTSEDD